MVIKIDEYLIEQEETYPVYWNVYRLGTIQDTESPNYGKEKKTNIVYGVTLPAAVHQIIQDRAFQHDVIVSLEQYVELYKKSVTKLTTEINEQLKTSTHKL